MEKKDTDKAFDDIVKGAKHGFYFVVNKGMVSNSIGFQQHFGTKHDKHLILEVTIRKPYKDTDVQSTVEELK